MPISKDTEIGRSRIAAASYATHRLIQSLCRSPELARRLCNEPDALFAEFGIDEREARALRTLSPQGLAEIGVHPILQIHFMMAVSPAFGDRMRVTAFADRLKGR